MTPHWHDGPLASLVTDGDAPVVWSVATRTDPRVAPTPDDLADAAAARDGAARLSRRLLARAMVAHAAGCAPADVVINRNALGAPQVFSPAGWHVGLSGNADHALIGVARAPIGVDREPLGASETLWDMLTPPEAAALRSMDERERADAWLRRWTIKEAHAKLIGEPRRIRPDAIETWVAADGHGGASFEGRSAIVTRTHGGAIETVAMWHAPAASPSVTS